MFIDTFYDVGPSDFASQQFRDNTARLLSFAADRAQPFQCKV